MPTQTNTQSSSLVVVIAVVGTLLVAGIVITVAALSGWIQFPPQRAFTSASSPTNTQTLASTAASSTEQEIIAIGGTYSLVGRSTGQSGSYSGTVTIKYRKNTADIYDLEWMLTSGQHQIGVGILNGDRLSVSYYLVDNKKNIKDIGAASYKVLSSDHLSGEWVSVAGDSTGGVEDLSLQPAI
jgi:hypothetical protein